MVSVEKAVIFRSEFKESLSECRSERVEPPPPITRPARLPASRAESPITALGAEHNGEIPIWALFPFSTRSVSKLLTRMHHRAVELEEAKVLINAKLRSDGELSVKRHLDSRIVRSEMSNVWKACNN